jgi:hypothetical protein
VTQVEPKEVPKTSSDMVRPKLKFSRFIQELTTLGYSLQSSYNVRGSTEAVHRIIVESPSTASPALVCYGIP